MDSLDIGTAAIAAGREVTISYTSRALLQRRPTKDLKVQFWYPVGQIKP